jgi:hypothetical protein
MDATNTLTLSQNQDKALFGPGEDFWSQAGSRGRIEMWVRGDDTDRASSGNSTETVMGLVQITQVAQTHFVNLAIGCPDRRPYLQVSDGVSGGFMRTDPIPSDGKWHFIGASWNMTPGQQEFRLAIDNRVLSSAFSGLSFSNLPATDNVDRLRFRMYLPVADLRITSGKFAPGAQASWANKIPFNPSVIMRRSSINLEGLAERNPREAYEMVNAYAQADLATTGFNPEDQFLYLPPRYWGEISQQVVKETLSPDTNLGVEFTPRRDVNRVYNQVAVTFKSSSVQQGYTMLYESTELIVLNPLQTLILTFPSQEPIIQLRDYAFAMPNGPTHAAFPPNPYNYPNYMTLNDTVDGTGTYATLSDVQPTIVGWNSGSITVSIKNLRNSGWFIVNNVNLPSIGLGGKKLLVSDDTFIAESTTSLVRRNTRMLPASVPVIQKQNDAAGLARELVARLSQPRIRFTTPVHANPERTPGRLVRVQDADNTGIDRLFRITGVSTTQEGHNIKQTVSAEESLPVLVWGVGVWGNSIWGEAAE